MASRGPLCGPPCGPKRVDSGFNSSLLCFVRWSPLRFWATRSQVNFYFTLPLHRWLVGGFQYFCFLVPEGPLYLSPVQVGAFPLAFFPAFYVLDQFCFPASLGTRSWTSVALLVGHNITVERGKRKNRRQKKKTKDSILSCPKTRPGNCWLLYAGQLLLPLSPCIDPVSLCFFFLSILALSPNGSGLRVETSASLSLVLSGVSSRVHIQSACAGPFQLAASK